MLLPTGYGRSIGPKISPDTRKVAFPTRPVHLTDIFELQTSSARDGGAAATVSGLRS